MQITKAWLKPHHPCADGLRWFLNRFPQGGKFEEVYEALRDDRRYSDCDWLAEKAFAELATVDRVTTTVRLAGADADKIRAHAATTGEGAHAATTGEGAYAATTGYRAHAATTGEKTVAASLGFRGRAKAGPGGCVIVAYRDADGRPRVAVGYTGENGIKADTWYVAAEGELVEVVEVAE